MPETDDDPKPEFDEAKKIRRTADRPMSFEEIQENRRAMFFGQMLAEHRAKSPEGFMEEVLKLREKYPVPEGAPVDPDDPLGLNGADSLTGFFYREDFEPE